MASKLKSAADYQLADQRGRGQWRGIAVASAGGCDMWTMSLTGRALPRARHIAKFLGLAGS